MSVEICIAIGEDDGQNVSGVSPRILFLVLLDVAKDAPETGTTTADQLELGVDIPNIADVVKSGVETVDFTHCRGDGIHRSIDLGHELPEKFVVNRSGNVHVNENVKLGSCEIVNIQPVVNEATVVTLEIVPGIGQILVDNGAPIDRRLEKLLEDALHGSTSRASLLHPSDGSSLVQDLLPIDTGIVGIAVDRVVAFALVLVVFVARSTFLISFVVTATAFRLLKTSVDFRDSVLLLEVVLVLGLFLLEDVVDLPYREVLEFVVPDGFTGEFKHSRPGLVVNSVVIDDTVDDNVTSEVGSDRINFEHILHPHYMLQGHVEDFVKDNTVELALLEILGEFRVDHDGLAISRCRGKKVGLTKDGVEEQHTKERAASEEFDSALDDAFLECSIHEKWWEEGGK